MINDNCIFINDSTFGKTLLMAILLIKSSQFWLLYGMKTTIIIHKLKLILVDVVSKPKFINSFCQVNHITTYFSSFLKYDNEYRPSKNVSHSLVFSLFLNAEHLKTNHKFKWLLTQKNSNPLMRFGYFVIKCIFFGGVGKLGENMCRKWGTIVHSGLVCVRI